MTNQPVTVVARMTAKPGKEAALKNELLGLVAPSRKDAGCLNYDLHQSPENPANFMFYENWESKALLDQHLATPHLKTFLAKAGDLLAGRPEIVLWEKISS